MMKSGRRKLAGDRSFQQKNIPTLSWCLNKNLATHLGCTKGYTTPQMMGSTTNLNWCKILETSSGLEEASGRLSNSPRTGQSISFLPRSCWWMIPLQTCLHLKGPPRYEEALGKIVAVVPKAYQSTEL